MLQANEVFFTVVIPACEVGKYIASTIESVKMQAGVAFETLIVCEDGRDDTLANAVAAIAGDCRFKIIQLPRSGSASVSRNYGMDHANGQYIVFVDGDDRLEPGALAKFASLATKNDFPEVIAGEYINWREVPGGSPEKCGGERPLHNAGVILSGIEFLTEALEENTYRSATWRNIYLASYLRASDLRQIPGRRHQDDEWMPRVLYGAERVLISGVVLYNYLKRANSVTTTVSCSSLRDAAANIDSALEFCNRVEFPSRLTRQFAHWQLYACSKFFSPAYCRLYPRNERKKEFKKLMFSHGNMLSYLKLLPYGKCRDVLFGIVVLLAAFFPWFKVMERLHIFIYGNGSRR